MVHFRRAARLSAVAVVMTTGACGGASSAPPATPPPSAAAYTTVTVVPPASSERLGATMRQAPGPGEPATEPGPAAAPQPPAPAESDLTAGLDDAQIVGVARTVADQAIRLARVGESKAVSRPARTLSHDVATGYEHLQDAIDEVAEKLKLVPTESRASTEVRALAADAMDGLREVDEQIFDGEYAAAQVRWQERALRIIDGLELHAVSPELRAELHHLHSRAEVFLHEAKSAGGR